MPTQAEVEAAAAWLHRKLDEVMPGMMRGRVTGQMEFDLCLGILEAAAKVRAPAKAKTK